MIVVHHMPRSRSWRILWLCAEADLACEARAFSYPPSADYLSLNPFGTIPLVEVDGLRLVDSAASLIYLAQTRKLHDLLPEPGAPGYGEVLDWTVIGETLIGMQGNVQAAATFFAPDGEKDNWSVRFSRERVLRGFAAVAARLGDSAFLLGDRFTLADISIGYITGVARGVLGLEADLSPNVLAWHDRLLARPAYGKVRGDD